MIVDFKEIPVANRGGGEQDQFEFFARDFFEALDYEIKSGPDRGADDNRDLIIVGPGPEAIDKTSKQWLVSCKHYAHSGRSVPPGVETDISDRVGRWECDGFLAFYSTIPSSGLVRKFEDFQGRFAVKVLDKSRIEDLLVKDQRLRIVLRRYFPNSYRLLLWDYIWEKLYMSVLSLAVGSEPIQERLIGAYIGGLCRVRQEYLPEDIRNEFLDIMSALTRIEPEGDEEGNLDATMKVMSNEEASSIAARIVAMYDSYRGALFVIPETRSGLWASFELSNAVLDR